MVPTLSDMNRLDREQLFANFLSTFCYISHLRSLMSREGILYGHTEQYIEARYIKW